MKREELVFNLSLVAVVVLMLVMNFAYRPGARQVPMLTGICTLGLLVAITVQLFRKTVRKDKSGSPVEPQAEEKLPGLEAPPENDFAASPDKKRKEAVVIIWLLLLTAASYLIGFLLAIPLYMFLFLFFFAKESWKTSLGMSVGIFVVIYVVFVKVLNVEVFKGLLI